MALNDAVAGHFFLLRGDLPRLKCSAILIPCGNDWEVTNHWNDLLQPDRFETAPWGMRLRDRPTTGRFVDLFEHKGRRIRTVVTTDQAVLDPRRVAAGIVAAIEDFAVGIRIAPARIKPLVELPLVGIDAGRLKRLAT